VPAYGIGRLDKDGDSREKSRGVLDSVFAFEGPELTRQATLETAFWNRDGHLRPNCGRGDVLSHISVLS
jgi:hypothetical protein